MYKNITLILSVAAIFCIPATYAAATQTETKSGSKKIVTQQLEKKNKVEKKNTLGFLKVWARAPLSPNNNSAVYMVIDNPTDQQITIIGASTMIANNVELHESFVDDQGISRMTSIDSIVVPAQSKIALKPGGIHIMLFDLKQAISAGDKFMVDIKIKGSTPIVVEAIVE